MTKKTKGLSFEEKKLRLSKAMIREGLFYNFKEIEAIAKKNGIVPQSVKEVLDCLVGDRIVIQEKIGSLNIFWAFASNEIACLENQIKDAESTLESLMKQSVSLTATSGCMKEKYPNLTELDSMKLNKELSDLESKKEELEKRLTVLLRNDPETIARLASDVKEVKECINTWTDNIFILRQFVCSRMGMPEAQVNDIFEIPSDLDLIEV